MVRSQAARLQYAGTRIRRLPVQRQGLNHSSLFERNMVNPTFRLVGGRRFRKERCGNAGRGTLEKAKAVL
jgi:hypothetical protein